MKCMKTITLAAFALCASQTVACMAPTDEVVADEAADASELAWADGSTGTCGSPFRGEFQRHDDGMGAHIAWKDSCLGSELVLWLESPDPEQPLVAGADVVGFIETHDGILGYVDGHLSYSADDPDFGEVQLAVARSGIDIGEIIAEIQYADSSGPLARVDAMLKLY